VLALAWLLSSTSGCGSTHGNANDAAAMSGASAATSSTNAGTATAPPPARAGSGAAANAAGAIATPAAVSGSGGPAHAPVAGSSGAIAAAGSGGASTPSAAGASGSATAGSSGSAASGPTLPAVMTVDSDGPFKTKQDLKSGPKGASGLFQPTELGQNGLKHPIFLFGCGGMSQPSSYADDLSRIATHGFVVLADVSAIGDDAAVFNASLAWLIAENSRADGPFFDKLDITKVAAGGHSIGSVNAFAFGPDPRLTTTVHVAGGSLDNVNDPSAPTTGMGGKKLVHPTAYICDTNDTFDNDTKADVDYKATTAPVFFTLMSGTDHIGVFKEAVPAIVAWLRWQLGGEVERRSMFLDPAGEFTTGRYMSVSKNW
jgi:hypothetical protein